MKDSKRYKPHDVSDVTNPEHLSKGGPAKGRNVQKGKDRARHDKDAKPPLVRTRKQRGPGPARGPFAGKRRDVVEQRYWDILQHVWEQVPSLFVDCDNDKLALWFRITFSSRLRAFKSESRRRKLAPVHPPRGREGESIILKGSIPVPQAISQDEIVDELRVQQERGLSWASFDRSAVLQCIAEEHRRRAKAQAELLIGRLAEQKRLAELAQEMVTRLVVSEVDKVAASLYTNGGGPPDDWEDLANDLPANAVLIHDQMVACEPGCAIGLGQCKRLRGYAVPDPSDGREGLAIRITGVCATNAAPEPGTGAPYTTGGGGKKSPKKKKGKATGREAEKKAVVNAVKGLTSEVAKLKVQAGKMQKVNRIVSGKGAYAGVYTGQGALFTKSFKRGLGSAGKAVAGAAWKEAKSQGTRALLSGMGAYTHTEYNGLFPGASTMRSIPTTYHAPNRETGELTVHAREYVSDVYGPATQFQVVRVPFNPGLNTMPKLSQLAVNHEHYRVNQLVYNFVCAMTDSSTNGQVGTIAMAFDHNPAATSPADKRALVDYNSAVCTKTTDNLVLGVECDPSVNTGLDGLCIRAGPVPYGEDIKTYDKGVLFVGLAGVPSALTGLLLGELHCEYDVTLNNPRLFAGAGYAIPKQFWTTPSTAALGATAIGTNLFGGTNGVIFTASQQNMAVLFTLTASGATLTLPASFSGPIRLLIVQTAIVTIAGGGIAPPTVTYSAGITGCTDFIGYNAVPSVGAVSYAPPAGGGAGSCQIWTNDLFVTPPGAGANTVITMVGNGSSCTSLTRTYVELTQLQSFEVLATTRGPNVTNIASGVTFNSAQV